MKLFHPETRMPTPLFWASVAAGLAVAAVLIVVLLPTKHSSAIYSSTPDTLPFDTNGQVNAVAQGADGTVYFGGSFSAVGKNAGYMANVSLATGAPTNGFPQANQSINAIVSDQNGGWYLGGAFTSIGGQPIAYLAHIKADNTVDQTFQPALDGPVYALAFSGTKLYAGTDAGLESFFTNGTATGVDYGVNGTDTSTVYAVALGDGVVYIGGAFDHVGEAPRNNAAAFQTSDDSLLAFDPDLDSYVDDIAVDGSTVYYSGDFGNVNVGREGGGSAIAKLAAFDATTGDVKAFNAGIAGGEAASLLVVGSDIYVGGYFETVNTGLAQPYLAAFDKTTGTIDGAFTPALDGPVSKLQSTGGVLYAVGAFTTVNATARSSAAGITISDGSLTAFDPSPNNATIAIGVSSDSAIIGGYFTMLGAQTRHDIAAYDPSTGQITAFDPNLTGYVAAITVQGSTVYAGGGLTAANGTPITNLAGFDAGTGALTSFAPTTNNPVLSLYTKDNILYAGGNFTTVNGESRSKLAAFDLTDGSLTAFNPAPNHDVYAITASGSFLYIGGQFSQLGETEKTFVSAISIPLASISSSADIALTGHQVYALAVHGHELYVGGDFSYNNGETLQNNFIIYDLNAKQVSSFAPNPNGIVYAVAADANTITLGGAFSTVGDSVSRVKVAMYNNNAEHVLRSFNPQPTTNVLAIESTDGEHLYLGGTFGLESFTSLGEDTEPPVITVLGDDPMHLDSGDAYIEPGVTAVDTIDGDLVSRVVTSGTVGTSPGTYTLTYTAEDYSGNQATAHRTVIVGGSVVAKRFAALARNEGITSDNGANAIIKATNGNYYVGGTFTALGLKRQNISVYDSATGTLINNLPLPTRTDTAAPIITNIIPDGSGGWYIAGSFNQLDGADHNGIGHVNADGSLDGTFSASLDPLGTATSMVLQGGVLYLGGGFTSVDGQARNGMAAVDAATGALLPFDPNIDTGGVTDMAIDGNTLYIVGSFTTVNGSTPRNGAAAIDMTTGTATPFDPDIGSLVGYPHVNAVAVASDAVYISGYFTTVNGGTSRHDLAAFRKSDGQATAFNVDYAGSNTMYDIALSGTTLFVGGDFDGTFNSGAHTRAWFTAFSTATSQMISSYPEVDAIVKTMTLDNGVLYLGGGFTTVGGQPKLDFAAIRVSDGAVVGPVMQPNDTYQPVYDVAAGSGKVAMVGSFIIVNGNTTSGLVMVTPTTWNVTDLSIAGSEVRALAYDSATRRLFVGGSTGLTVIDTNTNHTIATGLTFNREVTSLYLNGSTLYIGGFFSTVNGQQRLGLAAISINDYSLTGFAPKLDQAALGGTYGAYTLAYGGGTLYAAGMFETVNGGTARKNLAAFDGATGALVTSFSADTNYVVYALLYNSGHLFVGGEFTTIGGVSRAAFAGLDATTGAILTAYNRSVTGGSPLATVYTFFPSGTTLYIGGNFTQFGGLARTYAASINLTTGNIGTFNPTLADTVSMIYIDSSLLLLSGPYQFPTP